MMHIDNVATLSGEEAVRNATIQLIGKTSRYLRIRSPLLDRDLFEYPEVVDAISAFARKSRYAEVHILIDYPDRLLNDGHRLVTLMRRLSEKIFIRHYFDEPDEARDSYILSDDEGILIKPAGNECEAFFSLTDRVYTKKQREDFEQEWWKSPVARQLNTMIL
jgi:hypothetical protein